MVKSHGKKTRAKKRERRTGAAYTSAAAHTTHQHPAPDADFFVGMLPTAEGWEVDYALASRIVCACWAGCRPCQTSLTKKVLADRATLAALAGACYLNPIGSAARHLDGMVGPVTRAWAARYDRTTGIGTGQDEALRAVAQLSDADAAALLEDALDHWAGSGADRAALGLSDAPPRQRPADPMDAFRKAGVTVVALDDLDVGDDAAPYYLAPNYGVLLMTTDTPDGQPMPMLVLYPETEDAGIEDLEARTDWEHWGLHGIPDVDPQWRVRARIADRSLRGLVHVGADGEDDVELWRAAETVSLPERWWDLLDRAQHVLIAGPVKAPEAAGALQAAGDAGELLAVVARVSFL
ncbi:hypothetical protein [Streptomyces sp. NPDC059639]|uniref:hypothetical protein n=1 Tax=Streptomyces sp. NPDC059639 TaxID=3346891 RepID=UPI0036C1F0FE